MTAKRRLLDPRVRDLALIHVAAKQLRMDREAYVAMLQRVAGVGSAADLDRAGRARVIAELERLGFAQAKPRPSPKNRGRPKNLDREPMIAKIGALLAEIQAPWSYADSIARQMYRIEKVAWLRQASQLRAVIAALDARRRKLEQLEGRTS